MESTPGPLPLGKSMGYFITGVWLVPQAKPRYFKHHTPDSPIDIRLQRARQLVLNITHSSHHEFIPHIEHGEFSVYSNNSFSKTCARLRSRRMRESLSCRGARFTVTCVNEVQSQCVERFDGKFSRIVRKSSELSQSNNAQPTNSR